jgi:hypothetical protein
MGPRIYVLLWTWYRLLPIFTNAFSGYFDWSVYPQRAAMFTNFFRVVLIGLFIRNVPKHPSEK